MVEKAKGKYGAYAPDVPGCIAVGKTAEEALRRIQEALEFHFEGMVEGGEPIPPPLHVEAHFVEVSTPSTVPAPSNIGLVENGPHRFTRQGVGYEGFTGFVTFEELRDGEITRVPTCSGVYVVIYEGKIQPNFLNVSVGGKFKGKDPSVAREELLAHWVSGTDVIYIGKASSTTGLRKRLKQYMEFGTGRPVGHWGGRYIWQIEGCDDLTVAWKCATDETAEHLEARLQHEFCVQYGRLPFANLKKENNT